MQYNFARCVQQRASIGVIRFRVQTGLPASLHLKETALINLELYGLLGTLQGSFNVHASNDINYRNANGI